MTYAFDYQNQFRHGPEFFGACSICGERAGHKIEEELFYGPGHTIFDRVHPLTAELCSVCFKRVFMNYDGKRSPPGLGGEAAPPSAVPGLDQRVQQALSELREPAEESPLKIAILGVKRQPGAPEPVYITTPEEYLEAFPGSTSPPPEWFAGEPVTVIEVQDVTPLAPLYLGDDYPRIARRRP